MKRRFQFRLRTLFVVVTLSGGRGGASISAMCEDREGTKCVSRVAHRLIFTSADVPGWKRREFRDDWRPAGVGYLLKLMGDETIAVILDWGFTEADTQTANGLFPEARWVYIGAGGGDAKWDRAADETLPATKS